MTWFKEELDVFMNKKQSHTDMSTLGSSLVNVQMLSMALNSMTLEPITKKLSLKYVKVELNKVLQNESESTQGPLAKTIFCAD